MLEIVEGPGSGRQLELEHPIVIGRGADADLTIPDSQASRRHARVTPAADGSAIVEDLGSVNGTFVNNDEVYGPARLDAGDELLIGVTLIQLRSRRQVAARPSALRVVPQGLRIEPRTPDYVSPPAARAGADGPRRPAVPELEPYLDVRVRRKAQLAPLAVFTLVALALIIYFATR